MSFSPADQDRITHIFFPHLKRKTQEVLEAGGRFVYYTTAETATCILTNKQIWMRNTTTMNDYSEVDHGFNCLNASYNAAPGNIFNATLNACFPGLADEVKDFFNGWWPSIRQDTFIACVSEHLPEEDQHGRLSMWRAYGGQAGVALVINGAVMFSKSNTLNVFSSPINYLNPDAFAAQFEQIAKNMESEVDFIKSLGKEAVKQIVFIMLRFAVLCTKHPGFHEEREWRNVASPKMHPTDHATLGVEIIRGTPQPVLKLNLQNNPEKGLVGLAIPDLLDRIIIGPCEFPQVICSAFLKLLIDAEVPEPEKKIIVSDIPLRKL
ncbi:conserved protein of unknown function [Nitrospira defluvii]|jgi:hypothetical protein|uniref:DUF2971 domain-containing protein n=1 Tax=Nitrospira defluvii TaxID=330214 RepID=D8PC76_9BACT|nr:conserved protein of unknown function [Nitrospira defluvii]